MNPREFLDVDPRILRLPTSRPDGADPGKLQRQLSRHGISVVGMPAILLYRGSDGQLVIYDGVTRATRAAKFCPGQLIPAEVTGTLKYSVGHYPTVLEKLP